jgi:hypothetical protein
MTETPEQKEAATKALILAHAALQGMMPIDSRGGVPADVVNARVAIERVLNQRDPSWAERYKDIVVEDVRSRLSDETWELLIAEAKRPRPLSQ